jgi:hypothetical protein
MKHDPLSLTLSTIPAPIIRDHREPWKVPSPPPANQRCQRCTHVSSYLILSDVDTWLCPSCLPPERAA